MEEFNLRSAMLNQSHKTRGDIAILIALGFSVMTFTLMQFHQMMAGQRMRVNRRLADTITSFGGNEITAWYGYFREKAHLPAPIVIENASGSGSTGIGSGVPGSVFVPNTMTGTSSPRTSITPGNGTRFCGGGRLSRICISGPNKWQPPPDPVVVTGPWSQEVFLKASNNDPGDFFGVSCSVSGDTIAVGAQAEGSDQTTVTNGPTLTANNLQNGAGATYVYKRSGVDWTQESYLKAPNNDIGDYFGRTVNISGDTIVVGSPFEASNQTTITNGTTASSNNSWAQNGANYVFKRNGLNWQQEAYLKAPNSGFNEWAGENSCISGDTIAMGVYGEDSAQTTITNGTGSNADNTRSASGATYVLKRNGAIWAQEAYLKTSNSDMNDTFGRSTSISGNTIVVGVYLEDSNQTSITNGTLASLDNSKSQSGAGYVFNRVGVNWSQEAYLKASNADFEDSLGYSSSISGDTIALGAFFESSNQTTITNGDTASSNNSVSRSGAAYVFVRNGINWTQQAYLKAPYVDANDTYGGRIGLSGEHLVVGTYNEDSAQTTITNGTTASADNSKGNSGAAYVYKRTGTNWSQEAFLKASNSDAGDYFGTCVSASGNTIVVGAYSESSNQTSITNGTTSSLDNANPNSGAVYGFKRN